MRSLIRHPEHVVNTGFLFPDGVERKSCRDDHQTLRVDFLRVIFFAYSLAIDVPIF
jgi:hypothetical protein